MRPPPRRTGILAELSEDEIARLTDACFERAFPAGAVIIADGEVGEGLFILLEGTASVVKYSGSSTEIELARLHPGEHFGEMSLVTERPASATVRAGSAVVCLAISRARFQQLLDEQPEIARKVLTAFVKTLSARLTQIDREYAGMVRRERRREAVRHVVQLSSLYARMLLSYGWMVVRARVLRHPYSAEQRSRIHRAHARRYREIASRLKGATVKMAQLASMQQALLPAEYLDEFKQLRDKVSPSIYPLIAGCIQAELGASPSEIFAEFDRAPLAAASMGQVHRARLRTGEEVVVKVLHPGIARSVAIDLFLAKAVLRTLNLFAGPIDLMQIYRESEEPLREELNLLHEAQATETLGRGLEPFGVGAPKVFWQYSSRRVLTLQFIKGVPLSDVSTMNEWKVDRLELARTYLRAFFGQSLTQGHFHADPHASNALCTPDGKLVMLDFGMVKRLPDNIRRGLMKEWMGAFFRNPRMYTDGLIEKGAIGEVDRAKLEETAERFFNDDRMRNMIFGRELSDDAVLGDFLDEGKSVLSAVKSFQTPRNELMFLRGIGIAFDTVREIVPEWKLMDVAEPIYGEIFQQVIAENASYAAGPFRLSLRDADIARAVSRWLESRGLRHAHVTFSGGTLEARVVYPLARYGLTDVTVAVAATFDGFDRESQTIALLVTSLDARGSDDGFVARALGEVSDLAVRALAPLPRRVNLEVASLAAAMGSFAKDLRVDDLRVEGGSVVLERRADG